MENKIEINEYSVCIKELTNTLREENPDIYSLGVLVYCYGGVFKGFKVIKFAKPTEEGTWLTYRKFKNGEELEELEEYIEDLRKKFKKFKKKYFKEDEEG